MRRAALISLEPWDGVWRRNQHLAAELVKQGLLESIAFIEPPARTPCAAPPAGVPAGIEIVRPALRVPKRAGGLRLVGRQLRRSVLRDVDLLWVNDPALGVYCLTAGQPAVYDVTDDWRSYDFPSRIVRRIVRAENRLARTAATVVCSEILRERWQERYGLTARLVHNGIDARAWADVTPRPLPGAGPHVGYVGTVQAERLDIDLVIAVADDPAIGTVHLVGPDALDADSRRRLQGHPKITLHGPVPADDVPGWTVAMDVLVCPHRVTPFTLSLDAIKAREYLASGRPVVATPTSGFQQFEGTVGPVCASERRDFVANVRRALTTPARQPAGGAEDSSWTVRARDFIQVLDPVRDDGPRPPGNLTGAGEVTSR